jgi:hypothetical protein
VQLSDFYLDNEYCTPQPQLVVTSQQAADASVFTTLQMPAILAVLNYELATSAWPNLSSGFDAPGLGGSQPGQLAGLPSTAQVQQAIRAILNDPALTMIYTGKQSTLPESAGAQVIDDHTVLINQEGLYFQGAPLSSYTIAQHVIHELGHVFQQRNWTSAHLLLSTQASKEELPDQLETGLLPDNFAPDQIAQVTKYLTNARSIAGTWSSDYGDITFRHDPITGNQPVAVTGSWQQDNDPNMTGYIDSGTYDPITRKLSFSYTQGWDGSTGTASFTLRCGGQRMDGYCQGPWNAWRNLSWNPQ